MVRPVLLTGVMAAIPTETSVPLHRRTATGPSCAIGMRLLPRLVAVAVVLLTGLAGSPAAAQDAIGAVSRVQGKAVATRAGATVALGLDASVFLNQVVTTGAAARLEITFVDGTELTLGKEARVTLDRFVYDPAAGTGTVGFGIVGAFRYVSGHVSDLADADVSVSTPVARIGLRGTEFWAGPIDDQALGVLLLEGAVSVTNTAGQQVLDEPGEGTNIAAPGAAPGPVTIWPQDKVDRALAAVTFQ